MSNHQLFAHYLLTIRSLFAHYLPTIRSLFARYLPTIRPLFQNYLPTILLFVALCNYLATTYKLFDKYSRNCPQNPYTICKVL